MTLFILFKIGFNHYPVLDICAQHNLIEILLYYPKTVILFIWHENQYVFYIRYCNIIEHYILICTSRKPLHKKDRIFVSRWNVCAKIESLSQDKITIILSWMHFKIYNWIKDKLFGSKLLVGSKNLLNVYAWNNVNHNNIVWYGQNISTLEFLFVIKIN